MNFREHFETAWNITLKNIAILIVMTLVLIILSFLTLGILSPVLMAGFMHSVLLLLREGREPGIRDLFSHINLFFPLFGFSILVSVFAFIGFVLFVLPGIIVLLAVSYCCLYMLPLMTDQRAGVFKAVKDSFTMVKEGDIIDDLAVFIIFIGLLSVGSTTLIGYLFAQPFAVVFLISVYLEKTKQACLVEMEK